MIAEVSTIVARGMGVRRAGRWLLRPAAFGIAGGVTGLTGPPDAGKTTLLATIATLRRPHAGALEVLGYDAGDSSEVRSIRARIGYLPAGLDWAGQLCVQDFIGYAAFYKGVGKAAVKSVIRRLDLADVAGAELGRLPADVKVRAGLAATCVHDPDLVLLDEPLTGLEEAAAAELVPVLRGLAPAVLLTAACEGDLTGWCDRVLNLNRGRLTDRISRATWDPPRDHAGVFAATRSPAGASLASGPRLATSVASG
jgi:ABC-type multidrug transport system ATPase subunit